MPTVQAFIHNIFKWAFKNGHLHAARTLLDTKIDFSEDLQASQYTLETALVKGDIELIQLFLEKGVDVSQFTGILRCAKTVKDARLLLHAGVDVNEFGRPLYKTPLTALTKAVLDLNFKLVDFLIKEGADVNLAKKLEFNGARTLLRAALQRGDVRLTKLLLDNGAAVDDPSCP